jgi:lysophospholipase L1-like esterase
MAKGEAAWDTPNWQPPWLGPTEQDLRWRYSPGGPHNSLGLRDIERGPKVEGEHRILFLGDSLLYSSETSTGELVPQRVARGLSEDFGRIEGINAGVPGYTTWQELRFLIHHGLAMEPDRVVLCFVFNDVFDPYLHRVEEDLTLTHDPATRLSRFDTSALPGSLFARSYLAHETWRVMDLLAAHVSGRGSYKFETMSDQWLAWKRHPWARVGDRLRAMRDLLAQRGIPLELVVFPVREQFDPDKRARNPDYLFRPQRELQAIAEQLDIPRLDLTEAIDTGGGDALFSHYVHLNHDGNTVVAEAIETWLRGRLAGIEAR